MTSVPLEESGCDPADRSYAQYGRRVILVPEDDGQIVIFGRDLGEWAQTLDWAVPTAQFLYELLGGGNEAGIQGRCFTIRPEDEAAYDQLRKAAAGNGYIYGSLRDESGFAHAMAFREMDGAPVTAPQLPVSLMLATAVQLAAIEQQLARLEEVLETVGANVETILSLLRSDHAAAAAAAAEVLREITETVRRTGRLSCADWDRVAGLDETVRHRWLAVLAEMHDFRARFELTGGIKDDRHISRTLSAERWRQLVQQSYGLERAGLQWASAYAIKLQQDSQEDPIAVDRVHDWLRSLADRRDEIIGDVTAMDQESPRTKRRSNWELLGSEGIPLGRQRDQRDLRALVSFRKEIQSGSQPYIEFAELAHVRLTPEDSVP